MQLRFDAARSSALPPAARERLLALRDHRISADGVVVIKAQQFRSQEQNKAAALERLAELVRRALVVPKVRRETKPTRASQDAPPRQQGEARPLEARAPHARRLMARFDLVIFDCDGVVVDSERIVHDVFGAFIRSLGVHLSEAEMFERFLGRRLAECMAIVERADGAARAAGRARALQSGARPRAARAGAARSKAFARCSRG